MGAEELKCFDPGTDQSKFGDPDFAYTCPFVEDCGLENACFGATLVAEEDGIILTPPDRGEVYTMEFPEYKGLIMGINSGPGNLNFVSFEASDGERVTIRFDYEHEYTIPGFNCDLVEGELRAMENRIQTMGEHAIDTVFSRWDRMPEDEVEREKESCPNLAKLFDFLNEAVEMPIASESVEHTLSLRGKRNLQ